MAPPHGIESASTSSEACCAPCDLERAGVVRIDQPANPIELRCFGSVSMCVSAQTSESMADRNFEFISARQRAAPTSFLTFQQCIALLLSDACLGGAMGWFDLQLFETWWRALTAAPSITLVVTAVLIGIGWMIRGAFATAHVSGLNAHIETHDQRIALLKEQQEDAAKKAEELRRQIATIAARPEAQYTLAEALKQAETSATETTTSVGDLGATLAKVVLRQSPR